MSEIKLQHTETNVFECPKCGSSRIHKSRRTLSEKWLNRILYYRQRPFRYTTCKTRFWRTFTPHVWRRMIWSECRHKMVRLRWYLLASVIAVAKSLVVAQFESISVIVHEIWTDVWDETDLTQPELR